MRTSSANPSSIKTAPASAVHLRLWPGPVKARFPDEEEAEGLFVEVVTAATAMVVEVVVEPGSVVLVVEGVVVVGGVVVGGVVVAVRVADSV